MEDLFFIEACEKKKSAWKGRYDRPLIRIGADQFLGDSKKEGRKQQLQAGMENDKTERDTQSETISTPIIPWVPELAAVFGKNCDDLGGVWGGVKLSGRRLRGGNGMPLGINHR